MNSFTKEELEKLSLMAIKFSDRFNPNDTGPICIKIQSMIDNYCEHEWRKGIHLFNDVYCTKCKLHFEVNNEE